MLCIKQAGMSQSVERRIGSAEVTGSIPVTSFIKKGTSHTKFLFSYLLFLGQFSPNPLQCIIYCFFGFPEFFRNRFIGESLQIQYQHLLF